MVGLGPRASCHVSMLNCLLHCTCSALVRHKGMALRCFILRMFLRGIILRMFLRGIYAKRTYSVSSVDTFLVPCVATTIFSDCSIPRHVLYHITNDTFCTISPTVATVIYCVPYSELYYTTGAFDCVLVSHNHRSLVRRGLNFPQGSSTNLWSPTAVAFGSAERWDPGPIACWSALLTWALGVPLTCRRCWVRAVLCKRRITAGKVSTITAM